MLKIRRAIISVWDKKGITELAKKLVEYGVEIVSTGKTAELLRKSGVAVQEVANLTKFPEILSGRVKTLHPNVFGGILANKKHPLHMEEIKNLGIQTIDMVVVNLYPFTDKLKENLSIDEMIEYIDIGGVSLIRAAAKNFKNVACLCRFEQYKPVMEELVKNKGFIGEETLKTLAQEAFFITKEYDACIYNYFKGDDVTNLTLEKSMSLRYGENPHQKASLYRQTNQPVLKFKQLQGKEISFNNLLDLDTAFLCSKDFSEPAAVIVKHASLCGVGVDKRLAVAYKKAHAVDPLSSFGGIISLNRKVDKATAAAILKSDFKECIIAPSYSREALKMFSPKKNMRVLEADFSHKVDSRDLRTNVFGYLMQDRDTLILDKNNLKVMTKRKPTAREWKDMMFAWKVAKYLRSNAIVIASNMSILSLGGGQPSRVGAFKIAVDGLIKSGKGAVVASDGFFPKEDNIKLAGKHGIKAIIQPGGSIKDKDIIAVCDKMGISMVFTGIRHFRH